MSNSQRPSRRLVALWQAQAAQNPNEPLDSVVEQYRMWYEAQRAKARAKAARKQNKEL